ncbi:MAG: histidine triad nucleotide-binding protein [Polyangiaceae bacterium]|jgi:histidine triad (HIT) family protein|nr:histidine triad nucleotide-binding protein [Polyangiaceae bacterium]
MCTFCKIARKELTARIVAETEDLVAFHDINPQAPTHLLVIPRKHISSLDASTDDDARILGRMLLLARTVAAQSGVEGGYRVVLNTGSSAGQSVFHIHVHVLGGRPMRWPPG